jgi:16S rRNA G527 N7-methylase RsmG
VADLDAFGAALRRTYAVVGSVSDREILELFAHYQLLLKWNRVLNLTRVEQLDEAVERHYCEALFAADHLPTGVTSVLDVGSGAGFPGIPIAVRWPDCRVTLAESHVRKSVFLREASRDLRNVRVLARRAERGTFDCVVSRAVRWEDVVGLASREILLLLGADDASAAIHDPRFVWNTPIAMPWGVHRVLLSGMCST